MDYKHTRMEKVRKPELTEIKAKFKKYGVPTEAVDKIDKVHIIV